MQKTRTNRNRGKNNRYAKIILLGIVALVVIVLLFGGIQKGIAYLSRVNYPIKYSDTVEKYSKEYDLPLSLVYAVIRTESGFKPQAESSVGARGMMQIMEETFEWIKYRKSDERDITFDDMYDPVINIEYGTFMLSLLMEQFGTVENTLCAYHAGWGTVEGWLADTQYSKDGSTLDDIPFGDTDYYVNKVMKTQKHYQEIYHMQ